MCCSFHKLNGIGIQTLEKCSLRVSSFRCRKGSREAQNLPVKSKRATSGREDGREAFLTKAQKAKLCEQKLFVVGFPPTSCASATISTRWGRVKPPKWLHSGATCHAWHSPPGHAIPGEGTQTAVSFAFPGWQGEKSCVYRASYSNKLKFLPKMASFMAPLQGS